MIVVVIIGLLAAIGIANYNSMRKKAKFGACVSHQRQVHEMATLYASDVLPGTQVINVQVLTGASMLTPQACECPSSDHEDFDDYTVAFEDNRVTAITCTVVGAEHLYTP